MNADLSEISRLLWQQFWQVTLLALGVGVIVRVWCQERSHLAYLLWMLVIMKCVLPPVWSSPMGVFSWTPASWQGTSEAKAKDPLIIPAKQDAPTASVEGKSIGPIDKTSIESGAPQAKSEETKNLQPKGQPRPNTTKISWSRVGLCLWVS